MKFYIFKQYKYQVVYLITRIIKTTRMDNIYILIHLYPQLFLSLLFAFLL